MSDRKEHIEALENLMQAYENNECMVCDVTMDDEDYEALRFAIDSLKVDEAYQLEYERVTEKIPVTLNITEVKKHQSDFSDLENEDSQSNWISVKDRLPRANEYKNSIAKYYLVQNEYGDMMVARWNGIGWEQMYQCGYVEDKIVAWQELPRLFKEKEE